MDFTSTVNTVNDVYNGKRVTLTASTKEVVPDQISRRLLESRVRARAMLAAGFAKEGFFRDLNFRLEAPKLERRTEILSKDKVGPHSYRYEVRVNAGPILE